MQKEPTAQSLIHMSIELDVNVLEELPLGTGPRVGAKMGRERSPELPMEILINNQGSATGYIHSCLSFTVPRRPHHGAVTT